MSNESTLYKKMYKRNTNDSIQVWEIHRNENSYWTVSGKLDGKMIIGEPTLVEPKQKRTLEEQVVSVCDSQISQKIDKKYVDSVDDIDSAEGDLDGYSPMLAHPYDKHKEKLNFPVAVQRKYDGLRMVSTVLGQFSRGRKPFSSCPHVQKDLERFFSTHPDARLDGELYAEGVNNFEQIVSAVKKTDKHATAEDYEAQKMIKYYVYDSPRINGLVETDSFKDRYTALSKELQGYDNIVVVPTVFDVQTEEEIIKLKEQYIQESYEGAIIRQTHGQYQGKRSYGLLKMKDFSDSEFEITGMEEGVGKLAGTVGAFILKTDDAKTFNAKMDGSFERIKYLFNHPEECIGRMATVRYQGFTSDSIPRFPILKAIRGLKDRSDWI